jgi:PIN domain nuclease of toxin-antitoxin system
VSLLLDTNAILWLEQGIWMEPRAIEAIDDAASTSRVLVSAISAWEIGMLVDKGRVRLDLEAAAWFERFLKSPGVVSVSLTYTAALSASSLPVPFNSDPADRMLVATARELRVPIVTRDRTILAYAAAGHVQALPC